MELIANAAESSQSVAQPAPRDRARAKMLIAAALALAGCRLLGAWHSIVGMSAAGVVMVALAIGIVSVSPRLRRMIFFLALPLAVSANAAMLARGSILALMGSQGLLEHGQLAMNLPWTPLFWCVPFAAAANLWAFAKRSGPGFRNQRCAAMTANSVISLLAVDWIIHGAPYLTSPPPFAALLLLAVAAISFAVLIWDTPRVEAGTTPGRRHAPWRIGFVTVVSLAIVTAIVVDSVPFYRQRKTITELESLGFRLMPGWVTCAEMPPHASIAAADAERIGQLLKRLPELLSLVARDVRPGAGRLLRPLAGRRLTNLELTGPGVTDETLADIATLPRLSYLKISQASVTDDGLAELAKVLSLRTIDLSDTNISGEGLSKLASLPRLSDLKLRNVPLEDSDLLALEQFPALMVLNLRGTRVTDGGIERLRAALVRPVIINEWLGPSMPGTVPVAPAPNAARPTAGPPPSAAESPYEPLPDDAEGSNGQKD